jgi:hypothetical protein
LKNRTLPVKAEDLDTEGMLHVSKEGNAEGGSDLLPYLVG